MTLAELREKAGELGLDIEEDVYVHMGFPYIEYVATDQVADKPYIIFTAETFAEVLEELEEIAP